MFAHVACPTCQHTFSIPEGDMGRRHVCPNCQSPFFAGKTADSADAPAAAGYAKTMLGETAPSAPPIKFNCPRCKAPQEAPSIEALSKKPCSACGQRLQVPSAPNPPASAPPNLNKTMLADGSNPIAPPIKFPCPNCKKPLEFPALDAGTKKPCPSCSQRLLVPNASVAGPNLNKTMLASDGGSPSSGLPSVTPHALSSRSSAPATTEYASTTTAPPAGIKIGSMTLSLRHLAMGLGALFFLLVILPAVIRGGKAEDPLLAAKLQMELDKAKAEVEQRKADIKRQEQNEEQIRNQLKDLVENQRRQDEQMRDNHRAALRTITDDKTRTQLEEKFNEERRVREQEKREMEKQQQKILAEAKAAADASKAALEEAQRKQQTIIQQPPPVIYHPWYHPRYYHWW